jgi:hypothetical protein
VEFYCIWEGRSLACGSQFSFVERRFERDEFLTGVVSKHMRISTRGKVEKEKGKKAQYTRIITK